MSKKQKAKSKSVYISTKIILVSLAMVVLVAALSVAAQSLLADTTGSVGAWATSTNPLPNDLMNTMAVTANGYVYVMGGYIEDSSPQNNTYVNTVYYAKLNTDGSTGNWVSSTNSLPQKVAYGSAVVANGYVYVMGGNNGVVYFNNVYYAKLNTDGSVGAWATSTSTLPQTLAGGASVVANGYVYFMGGWNQAGHVGTVYYASLNTDGSVGAWATSSNALPHTLALATSITSNNYIYFMGGTDGTLDRNTVYYAKLNTDGSVSPWLTSPNSIPQGVGCQSMSAANGYVYLMGGDDIGSTSGYQNTVYYTMFNTDGSISPWTTSMSVLPTYYECQSSITANNYLYVIGGRTYSGSLTTVLYAYLNPPGAGSSGSSGSGNNQGSENNNSGNNQNSQGQNESNPGSSGSSTSGTSVSQSNEPAGNSGNTANHNNNLNADIHAPDSQTTDVKETHSTRSLLARVVRDKIALATTIMVPIVAIVITVTHFGIFAHYALVVKIKKLLGILLRLKI